MKKFNWWIKREQALYQNYGLALTTNSGCLGTTFGQEGWNWFRTIQFTFLLWTWSFTVTWKSNKGD